MSLRKMLRVSLLMLLAMTLAATGGHARLDLFGLLTSQNQPNPTNSGGEWIPYLECIQTCDKCVCDKRIPELAMCICADSYKKPAAPLHNSAEKVQVQEVAKVKSELIPYEECLKNCKSLCACTLIWPPEASLCICGDDDGDSIKSSTAKAASRDDTKMVLWTKAKLDSISHKECAETCGQCACTKPLTPVSPAACICLSPKAAAGRALSI